MGNLSRSKKFNHNMNEHSFNYIENLHTNAYAFIYLHLRGDVL